jgi:hypothetical protein
MSTLKVTNIQSNGAGFNDVVSFQNSSGTENGTLCRAFVNFDGTFASSPFTIANGGIRASGNVSSVTDNGTGDYTVNFTNALADANYAVITSSGGTSGVIGEVVVDFTTPRTSLLFRFVAFTTSYLGFDCAQLNVAIFR